MTKSDKSNRELQLKIDEYGDMLFKLSYMRLQNVQDAEDVVQEVFYQYLKHDQVSYFCRKERAASAAFSIGGVIIQERIKRWIM